MLTLTSAVTAAQPVEVERMLAFLGEIDGQTLEDQIAICEIPAPPFHEQARGEDFARRFRAIGLENVRIDEVGNVLGQWGGTVEAPLVSLQLITTNWHLADA